jgi:hypothetical protein
MANFSFGVSLSANTEIYNALADYAIIVTRLAIQHYVATTNNASNYWLFKLYDVSSTAVQIATSNSYASSPSVWSTLDLYPGSLLVSSYKLLSLTATKQGNPGTLDGSAIVHYRITAS